MAMDDQDKQWPSIVAMLPAILPGNPPEPCPELLVLEEAVRYLRLDVNGPREPELTLRRYRELGLLRGTRVGRRILYRRIELDRFLAKKTENSADSS